MPRRRVSIQWQPARDRGAESTRSVAVERVQTPVSARPSISRILEQVGTPEVTGATTPKEEAIGLLQLAAEIEHSLMVQYLYAAASLPPAATGGVNGPSKLSRGAVAERG